MPRIDEPRFCDEPTGYYTDKARLAHNCTLNPPCAAICISCASRSRVLAAFADPTTDRATPPNPMFAVFSEMREITLRKNSDYANSTDVFRNFRVCEQMGTPAYEGVVIRMSDKFSRILNLIEKGKRGEGAAVVDESLRDTLLDLANYACIAVCLLDEKGGN